ncbi:MAG: hypothetical protein BIFFINMI_01976 [Phycisphaerae bacterium]|nr:hypothetical protein [Phycisphaerae bacterium]
MESERVMLQVFVEDVRLDLQKAIPGFGQPAPAAAPTVAPAAPPAHQDGRGEVAAHAPTTDPLEPAERKAYQQYAYAVEQSAMPITKDREAYDWLAAHLDSGDKLPAYETWTRYLRSARKALGEQKNKPRRGRQAGRSVVRDRDIDRQGTSDAD